MLPKHHAGYRSDNALFREMVGEFVPPSWAKLVIVGGDAAYGSKANMRMVQDRDKEQHLDNLRRKDSLRGAETAEISVRLGNYSASHFEGSAKADGARRWGFVFAIARTWKTVEEKTLKNLTFHPI
jgi:hypothetical protein